MQVLFGSASHSSMSSRGSPIQPSASAVSPSYSTRDWTPGLRTNGWVAEQLDFTDSQQQIRRTHSGRSTSPSPFAARRLPPNITGAQQPTGRTHSSRMPNAPPTVQNAQQQEFPASLEQIGRMQLDQVSAPAPTLHGAYEQEFAGSLQQIGRAHSGCAPSPSPTAAHPGEPRSASARRAYRFIDDGGAPSSCDEAGFRNRRPLSRVSGRPGADQARQGGPPTTGHVPSPREALARDLPQTSRPRSYAFIDDSSGDEGARRRAPAASLQLPLARPTTGWIDQPVAANPPGRPRGPGQPDGPAMHAQYHDHRDGPQGHPQDHSRMEPAAEPAQRITPGMRREQEERHRNRSRLAPRTTYAFIDDEGSGDEGAGM